MSFQTRVGDDGRMWTYQNKPIDRLLLVNSSEFYEQNAQVHHNCGAQATYWLSQSPGNVGGLNGNPRLPEQPMYYCPKCEVVTYWRSTCAV